MFTNNNGIIKLFIGGRHRFVSVLLAAALVTTSVFVASKFNAAADEPVTTMGDLRTALQQSGTHVVLLQNAVSFSGAVITITGDITLKGASASAVLSGNATADGFIKVASGGKLTLGADALDPITLSGNTSGPAIKVESGGTFVMNGGEIKGCGKSGSSYGGGICARETSGSTSVIINGGKIHDNVAHSGGGVYMDGTTPAVSLVINGGSIYNNTADNGGGVYVINSKLADHVARTTANTITFTINNADIYNNVSKGDGGGIWTDSSNTVIAAAKIHGNTASKGGGIWTQEGSTVNFKNMVITDNKVEGGSKSLEGAQYAVGGGIWCCPHGNSSINVTEGIVLAGNTVTSTKSEEVGGAQFHADRIKSLRNGSFDLSGAGRDYAGEYTLYGWPSWDSAVYIATRMLGGGAYTWYIDSERKEPAPGASSSYDASYPYLEGYIGKRYSNSLTSAEKESIKLIPLGNNSYSIGGKTINLTNHNEINLTNVVDETDLDIAKSLGSVFVYENTAWDRGGGIATNGRIVFGVANSDISVNVEKSWDDSVSEANRPQSITVSLVQTANGVGRVIETAELSSANSWAHSFIELPSHYVDNLGGTIYYSYTVTEAASEDYEPQYTTTVSGDTTTVHITNVARGTVQSSVEPSSVEPSSEEPSSVEPSSVEPSSVEPSSVEPSYEETSSEETSSEEASSEEASSEEASSEEPSSVEPSSVELSSEEPSSVEPSSVEPSSVEPSSVEPSSDEPSSLAPSSVEPSSVAPSLTPSSTTAASSPAVQSAPPSVQASVPVVQPPYTPASTSSQSSAAAASSAAEASAPVASNTPSEPSKAEESAYTEESLAPNTPGEEIQYNPGETTPETPDETAPLTPTDITRADDTTVTPPAPASIGDDLVKQTDGTYMEYGEDGTPLGTWSWDDDMGEWVYEPIALGRVNPKTRDNSPVEACAVVVLLGATVSAVMLKRRVKAK